MIAVEFSPEALAIVGALVCALTGAVGLLWKILQKQTQDRMDEKDRRIETLQKIADDGAMLSRQLVARELTKLGLPVVENVPAVVPIKNSPVTQDAIDRAKIETSRAILAEAFRGATLIPGLELPPVQTADEVGQEVHKPNH